jgi:S-adenosylmethionine hydrolase
VDPGVGTARRALAGTCEDHVFVGPDNGVLAPVLAKAGARVVELANPRFARPEISRTFEGRDRFAPAGAWLARGIGLDELGPPVESITRLPLAEPRVQASAIAGEVLKVDRFGNLISNVDQRLLERCACAPPVVRIAGRNVLAFVQTYGETAAGELCTLVGSSGYLEVAVNGGSAAERLRAGRGTALYVGKDLAALDVIAGRLELFRHGHGKSSTRADCKYH